MRKQILVLFFVIIASSAFAQVVELLAPMPYPIVATGNGRIIQINPDGSVKQLSRGGSSPHDVWVLDNGNILVAGNNDLLEYKNKRRVFRRKSKNRAGDGIFTCQPLENGGRMFIDSALGKLIEVDHKGKEIFSMPIQWETENRHNRNRTARKLKNGNYLICHSEDNKIKEYQPDGTVIWELKTPDLVFAASRLENGNTMASTLSKIYEYSSEGEVIWSFGIDDLPVKGHNFTGFHLLPDDSIVIGCYAAYSNDSKVGIFQVNRNKEVLWYYSNPKGDHSLMGVQMLYPGLSISEGNLYR